MSPSPLRRELSSESRSGDGNEGGEEEEGRGKGEQNFQLTVNHTREHTYPPQHLLSSYYAATPHVIPGPLLIEQAHVGWID